MSGEIYTTVVGPVTKREAAKVHDAAQAPDESREVTVQEDGTEPVLAGFADRFARDAAAANQRFKRYSHQEPRRAVLDETRKSVAKHLESAVTDLREKRFEDAIEHLLKALAKDDGDPRGWLLLGGTYLRIDRPFKAAVAFLRALELDRGNANAWLGLSRSFKATGDSAGALEVLDHALQTNESVPDIWSERGLALEALQNVPEAVRSFAKALDLDPDHRLSRARYRALSSETQGASGASELPNPQSDDAAPVEAAASPATSPEAAEAQTPQGPDESQELPEFDDLVALAPQRAQEQPRAAKVLTYVEGLDEVIGGGVPWGHVVLIQGAPGTMKSSLGFSILLHNAIRDGMHGLYISLEERSSSLLKQMGSIGLHLQVDKGSLVVLDPRSAKGLLSERSDWIDGFTHALAAIKAERGLDLVVIDSLEALEVLAKFKDHRREMYRLFEWLRDLGVTSFLITERPDWVIGGQILQGRWDEDFLADGVLHLRQHFVSDLEVQRRLRVVKMRGTKHEAGYLALVLDEGRFKVTRAMSP
jgi:KaiC/GvpD/RAD55 family RecA-like ATPase